MGEPAWGRGDGIFSYTKTENKKVRAVRSFNLKRTDTEKANEQRWRQLGIEPSAFLRTMSIEEAWDSIVSSDLWDRLNNSD